MPKPPPRLSGKEHLILEMLAAERDRELYGLELVGLSRGRLVRGTVYVTLGRMEEKGLILSRQEDPGPGIRGIPRRMYRVSALGSRMLAAYRHLLAATGRLSPALGRR